MSKENLEQFMKQVAGSEDLQAKIGEEITGEALVALGAGHGCEFSIADVQASAELSDAELGGVSGGLGQQHTDNFAITWGGDRWIVLESDPILDRGGGRAQDRSSKLQLGGCCPAGGCNPECLTSL